MKVFSKDYFKQMWKILVATFMGFIDDNGLKLSASLAYYTVFSIAPLLILVISLASIFFSHDAATNRLYPEISHYVGSAAAFANTIDFKKLATFRQIRYCGCNSRHYFIVGRQQYFR